MWKNKGYRMHNSELRLHPNSAFDNPFFFCCHQCPLHIDFVFFNSLYIYICIYPSCKASPHRAGRRLWCWKGSGTEECDFGNVLPPTPTPHTDSSENVGKQLKLWQKHETTDPKWDHTVSGTLQTHPFEIQWLRKIWFLMNFGAPKWSQMHHFRCKKASTNTPRNC